MSRNQKQRRGVNSKSASHKLFFIGPEADASMDSLGDALIGIKSVKEVKLREHILGYSARVSFFSGESPANPAEYIARHVGKDFGLVRDA